MKRLIVGSVVALLALSSASAIAQELPPPGNDPWVHAPLYVHKPRHRWVGLQFDVGAPDGAAAGLVLRPIPDERYDWFRLVGSVTYNGLEHVPPGVRGGLTFDPLRSPVAPTLTGEVGHAFAGTIYGVNGSPTVSYDYVNVHLGLEFGNRNVWRFFLRGGVSWINLQTGNFQGALNLSDSTIVVGNPTFNGFVAPTGKLGFDVYF